MSIDLRVSKFRLGDDIASECGRCKGERTHQIAALNPNGRPAIVICRTCRNQHNYRDRSTTKVRRAGPVNRGTGETKTARAVPAKAARPYSARETYHEGEWIEHAKFGCGEVTGRRGGKIEVRFGAETRVLIHELAG